MLFEQPLILDVFSRKKMFQNSSISQHTSMKAFTQMHWLSSADIAFQVIINQNFVLHTVFSGSDQSKYDL